jgi:hypothetical protein
VQLLPGLVKVPAPVVLTLTEPVGVRAVPWGVMSTTVIVQVVVWPTKTTAGKQLTVVLVARGLTVIEAGAVVLLPLKLIESGV